MKLFISENAAAQAAAQADDKEKAVALDDLFLTTDLPTTGGSNMLEGYMSLFNAEVVDRLMAAGYAIAGKANTGEFGACLLGESSAYGACENAAGALSSAVTEILAAEEACAALSLDVNGTPRRAAACAGQVCIKPSYGTVSRFGTIAVACSGETVDVTARTVAACREVLGVLVGHDDKDGTSLPQETCARVAARGGAPVKRVAVSRALCATADEDTQKVLAQFEQALASQGIELVDVPAAEEEVFMRAHIAWNILMSAELCNNVSRFDGVKYGHRAADYETIGELYTNSRTEGFGDLLKTLILYGSEVLSTENYDKVYDKALRVRRLVVEAFVRLFDGTAGCGAACDAVLMPACSQRAYTLEQATQDKYLSLSENRFTAPASISGLPAVVVGGMQLIGPALSDAALLDAAEQLEANVSPMAKEA